MDFVSTEEIVLTREGLWLSDGVEIDHEPTRKLFSRSLVRDAEGYFLKIGRETKRIEVQDTAYFVIRYDENPTDSSGAGTILLSDGTRETLDPSTLSFRPGRLTCRIRNGEEAKFLHAPYFDLLRTLREDAGTYYLEFDGKRAVLASPDR